MGSLIIKLVVLLLEIAFVRASFDNLVTFGASYTDNGRLNYYTSNGGNAPPPGTLPPTTNVTASGGLSWGQLVQQTTGVAYFDYAISGAVCSNAITPRFSRALGKIFPAVIEDELPAFVADKAFPELYGNATADNTVYALWIITNDVGVNAILTDSQIAGTNITTYIECVWSVFDVIYSTGGRRFVLLNAAPLQLTPLYASPNDLGAADNQYWKNKTAYNTTEYAQKMLEYTQLINVVFDYGVPFNLLVQQRWPGATLSIFDTNALLNDIFNNPSQYLDAPAKATGVYHSCSAVNTSDCVNSPDPISSFLWYDELHPTEKTHTYIAQEFINVVAGNSSYGASFGKAEAKRN